MAIELSLYTSPHLCCQSPEGGPRELSWLGHLVLSSPRVGRGQ